uniref:Uncharacterized protein n=1 Tax=Pseudomonas phage KV2023 TaxID=3234047 RepID=A0AB39C6P7_9CAUD
MPWRVIRVGMIVHSRISESMGNESRPWCTIRIAIWRWISSKMATGRHTWQSDKEQYNERDDRRQSSRSLPRYPEHLRTPRATCPEDAPQGDPGPCRLPTTPPRLHRGLQDSGGLG